MSQDFGSDFRLWFDAGGTPHTDFLTIVTDERVVSNAVLSKILGETGAYWWAPDAGCSVGQVGKPLSGDYLSTLQACILRNIESENQTSNAYCNLWVEAQTTLHVEVSWSVADVPFAYDVVVNGQALNVFVGGAP
jgi:hypothetical protein